MITITKSNSTFFIYQDKERIGICSTFKTFFEPKEVRFMTYLGSQEREPVPARDFTLSNIKTDRIYELILKYFPNIRLGQRIKLQF